MKKLIFDLDNTLLYLSDDWVDCLKDFIKKSSIDVEPVTLLSAIAKYEDMMSDAIITKTDLKQYLAEVLSITIDDTTVNNLLGCYNNIPLRYTNEVHKLLSNLSKKYELIAYTNWFKDDQIIRLNKYDLDKYFSNVFGWDVIPAKPSLKGLQTIIKGCRPTDFTFIGDNVKSDLEIPFEIGMNTIFLNTKGIKQSKYKEIKNIEELDRLL